MRDMIIRGNQLDSLAIISSKRDVIIKSDKLHRMAISRTRQDMIIKGEEQDRAAISSKVDTMYAHDLPPFHMDSKQVCVGLVVEYSGLNKPK